MHLTAKSRYALKILLDLAHHGGQGQAKQRRHELALRQHIPVEFMDHILAKLRHAGLVHTLRGRCGGIMLARDAASITVWDMVSAVEDHIYPVRCLDDNQQCDYEKHCLSLEPWHHIFAGIKGVLEQTSLGTFMMSPPTHPRTALDRPGLGQS